MAYLSPKVLDQGLDYLVEVADSFVIFNSVPTTYDEAVASILGFQDISGSLVGPEDHVGGGRQIRIPAMSGVAISFSGVISSYGLMRTSKAPYELLLVGGVREQREVLDTDTFSTPEIIIWFDSSLGWDAISAPSW